MLLGARADLNKVDESNHTALDEACKHGHDRIIKLLAAAGCQAGLQRRQGLLTLTLSLAPTLTLTLPLMPEVRHDDECVALGAGNRPCSLTSLAETPCVALMRTSIQSTLRCASCRQPPCSAPASSTATCRW